MWCYLHLDAVKEGTCVNSVNQRQHSLSLFAHQLSPLNYTAISRVNIPKIACWKGKLCKCHFEVRCLNHMNHHQFLCNRSLNVTFKVSHSREGVQSTPLEWEKGGKKNFGQRGLQAKSVCRCSSHAYHPLCLLLTKRDTILWGRSKTRPVCASHVFKVIVGSSGFVWFVVFPWLYVSVEITAQRFLPSKAKLMCNVSCLIEYETYER